MMRETLALCLRHEGFSVLTADNGVSAIEAWERHRDEIDVVLSDVMMPAMDGPSMAEALHSVDPQLPIVLMSGYCQGELLNRCRAFPFLTKPLSISTLVDAILHAALTEEKLRPIHV
jgi:two-component system cell cycle sensor histidine kinase/response regulator CckA